MPGPQRAFDSWTEEEKQEKLAAMIEIAKRGGHQAEMCIALGLKSEDTFYRWKREIPEFKAMCEEAKVYAKAFYEQLLLKGGLGLIKGFNTASIMSLVNAKFGDEYKQGSGEGGTVNNTTVNVLNISAEEIQTKIAQKIELLKKYGEVYQLDEPINNSEE